MSEARKWEAFRLIVIGLLLFSAAQLYLIWYLLKEAIRLRLL